MHRKVERCELYRGKNFPPPAGSWVWTRDWAGPGRWSGAWRSGTCTPGTRGWKREGIAVDHHGKTLFSWTGSLWPCRGWNRIQKISKAGSVYVFGLFCCFLGFFTTYMHHAVGFSTVNQHFQILGRLKSGGEKQTSKGWSKVEKQA